MLARVAELRKIQWVNATRTKGDNLRFLAAVIDAPIGTSAGAEGIGMIQVGGGKRGKLKRGKAGSGNELVGEPEFIGCVKIADKLRPVEIYFKLTGHYAPEQVMRETGPTTLEQLEARAAAVVSALDRQGRI